MRHPPTIGLILAGGRSTRMGGNDKSLALLAGRPLLAHMIERLGPQTDELVLSSNADPANFAAYGLPALADVLPGYQGPVAGIHAALDRFPDRFVLAVAVDLPLLPADLAVRLHAGLGTADCAYASDGSHHALAILFRPGVVDIIHAYLVRGGRNLKDFLSTHGTPVVFDRPSDRGLFMNLNTPDALARAERELASGGR